MTIGNKRFAAAMVAAIVGVLALFPGGCGGGGGGAIGTTATTGATGTTGATTGGVAAALNPTPAGGKTTLPAGTKLTLTQLTANTGADTQPVAANGTFKLNVIGGGLCPVFLEDSNGDLVMAGFVDPRANGTAFSGGKGVINATTTATFLLYYALGGFTSDPGDYDGLIADIAAAPQTATLANTITTRVVANPLALQQQDPQIVAGVKTAANSILTSQGARARAAQMAPKSVPAETAVTIKVRKPQTSGGSYQVLVTPGEQSGVTPLVSSTAAGIAVSFQNQYRRRCAAYAYETATESQNQNQLQYITPVPITTATPALVETAILAFNAPQPTVPPFEIQPANAIHGTFGSIVDYLYGQGALTPVTTSGMVLPVDPSYEETDFTIVVLGPSEKAENYDQIGIEELKKYIPDWQNTVAGLSLLTVAADVLLPMAFSLPFSEDFQQAATPVLGAPVVGDAINAAAAAPDAIIQYKQGGSDNYVGLQNSIVQNVADSGSWRDSALEKLVTALYTQYGKNVSVFTLSKMESFFERMSVVLAVADYALLAVDVYKIVWAAYHSEPMTWWTAKALTGVCGADPAPVLSNAYTLTLNKQNYYGGQTGTATIQVQPGFKEMTFLELAFQYDNTTGTIPVTDLKLDGKDLGANWPSELIIKLSSPGSAETHVVTFTFGQPNRNNSPVDFCSAVAEGPQLVLAGYGPYDFAANVAFLYFNVLPADVK